MRNAEVRSAFFWNVLFNIMYIIFKLCHCLQTDFYNIDYIFRQIKMNVNLCKKFTYLKFLSYICSVKFGEKTQ